ncbi:MAG TPA: hypothetical protein VKG25_23475 [Bryobacteraceae bacterium]|nr:hypothetical protein [Bryobacteraceae bacterium]
MSAITAEMEMELAHELAHEYEASHEFEAAHEHQLAMEQQAFFNHLAAMADRGGRSQALRRIALVAAREALRSVRTAPPVIEGESEFAHELSFELEAASNPLRAEHANAMMEHMSHEAVTAESEQEAAEQFLPLVPLAAKVILPHAAKFAAKALPSLAKKVAPRIMARVVPHLTRGVSQVARTLFRNSATRPLLRAVPNIAKRTIASVARLAAQGRPITPSTAVSLLARQTARTLSCPRQAVMAFRRSRALDHRYHRAARRLIGRRTVAPTPAIPWRPIYSRSVYGAPAGVATAPIAIAPCQCFQPVNCASCGR